MSCKRLRCGDCCITVVSPWAVLVAVLVSGVVIFHGSVFSLKNSSLLSICSSVSKSEFHLNFFSLALATMMDSDVRPNTQAELNQQLSKKALCL